MSRFLVIAASVTLALHSVAAIAAQRTFVASGGSDANPCSISQPCRGFAAAMTHTDANGEIIVLDSAGYGVVTVNKSVSIIAPPGVYAGISAFSGENGVTIAAGASDKIVLRGLRINGQGGDHGIAISQVARVDIQGCAISNMGGHGIFKSFGASKIYVDRTRIANNGGTGIRFLEGDLVLTQSEVENNASDGVFLFGSGSTIQATVHSTFISGNGATGLHVFGDGIGSVVHLTADDTGAVRNVQNGFSATANTGNEVITFVVTHSVASRNGGVGFDVYGSGVTASAAGSTLARNYTFDMRQRFGAVLRSHGNNALSGDGPGNVSGTITQIGLY